MPVSPWTMPDRLWRRVERLLRRVDPTASTGRPRAARRLVVEGIVHRFLGNLRWRRVPPRYGDHRTLHRTFRRWERLGVFELIWEILAPACPELADVEWKWEPPPWALRRRARRPRASSA